MLSPTKNSPPNIKNYENNIVETLFIFQNKLFWVVWVIQNWNSLINEISVRPCFT